VDFLLVLSELFSLDTR